MYFFLTVVLTVLIWVFTPQLIESYIPSFEFGLWVQIFATIGVWGGYFESIAQEHRDKTQDEILKEMKKYK